MNEEKIKLLRKHGLDCSRNEYGVKDQSNSFRFRNGILFRGFDCGENGGNEQSKKEIDRIKKIGLKCFREKQDDFFRVFEEVDRLSDNSKTLANANPTEDLI